MEVRPMILINFKSVFNMRFAYAFLLGTVVFISACSESKSVSSVFPEGNPSFKNECANQTIENEYIVQWENGQTELMHSFNEDQLVDEFIRPNLSELKLVERNRKIKLEPIQLEEYFSRNEEAVSLERNEEGDLSQSNLVEKSNSDTDREELFYWGQKFVNVQSAWDQGIEGEGIKIGVVDAAVDYRHPQIAPQLLENRIEIEGRDGVDDDGNGYIDDYFGWDFVTNSNEPIISDPEMNFHGTHVSGIIAANRAFGLAKGIAPESKIIPANIMDEEGNGDVWASIKGIQYVESRGARIINASWGGKTCSRILKNTIDKLEAKNILFVSASGNEGLDLDLNPRYPSAFNFKNQLNVAAINSLGNIMDFSNTSFELVHVGAPGVRIMSTVPGGYGLASGTSMAAPFVSGAAALLLSYNMKLSPSDLKSIIINSVDEAQYRVKSHGSLNILKALRKMQEIQSREPRS